MQQLIIINEEIMQKYDEYYFKEHPKRKVKPLKKIFPPSINEFTSMKRMAQNGIKQKWKEFIIWLVDYHKLTNAKLNKVCITYTFYFQDRRQRDYDNLMMTPKFINDGFVVSGMIVEDNYKEVKIKFNEIEWDKINPRLEILIENN
jgi:hypothetical protein